jgi:Schlafen, AlbA_2
MFTFSKPLNELTEADLQRLVEDGVRENRQLEYKRDLPGVGAEEKKEFVRDVVSFANSAGGHIIFGIATSNGIPTQLAPLSEENVDDAKLRLENIIRTSIEPTIQGLKMDEVRLANGCALIIEIPRGLFGLHMIKNRRAFIARTSAGKSDLDVNEIRAAFVGAEAAVARLSEFRADRTAKIINGDTLWPLASTRVLAIHLLPLVSFSSRYTCAIDQLPEEVRKLLYPAGRRPWNFTPKFTFDGFANLMSFGTGQAVEGYSQIFRNGAIETVNAAVLEQSPNRDTNFYWLELLTMDCAERMLKIMDLLQISGPYYLLLSLLNVKGLRMAAGAERHYNRDVRVIDQPHLIVPEVLLQDSAICIEKEMRNSFDMLWNACGWQRSWSYDADGNFPTNWGKTFQ